eukprot:jgi/Botrbrau1/13995/Bobra.150_1s0006.1
MSTSGPLIALARVFCRGFQRDHNSSMDWIHGVGSKRWIGSMVLGPSAAAKENYCFKPSSPGVQGDGYCHHNTLKLSDGILRGAIESNGSGS